MTRFAALPIVLALAGCATPGVTPGVRQVGVGDCHERQPHGPYRLQLVDGPVLVTGSFAEGKKEGVFTFFSTGGTKVAEIPYSGDVKNGTILRWYSEFAYREAAGRPKLEAEYTNDAANGHKRSW